MPPKQLTKESRQMRLHFNPGGQSLHPGSKPFNYSISDRHRTWSRQRRWYTTRSEPSHSCERVNSDHLESSGNGSSWSGYSNDAYACWADIRDTSSRWPVWMNKLASERYRRDLSYDTAMINRIAANCYWLLWQQRYVLDAFTIVRLLHHIFISRRWMGFVAFRPSR